jgi:release factor glutamine methyltransferase
VNIMTTTPTVAESLQGAARTLAAHSDSPRLDAELLLCTVTGWSRAALIVNGAAPLAVASRTAYEQLILRRTAGAPVAYLTGRREFWSLPLCVTPDVLVPRPETELLVELALAVLPGDEPSAVLDLGTGSGAIALAIASERPRARVTAVDVSPPALAVAAHNARILGLTRIEWLLGSWFDAVADGHQRFDVIVANPPYVAAADPALERLAAEPVLALTPGRTGLEALGVIAARAAWHLKPGGWLILEHGDDQGEAVTRLLAAGGFTEIRTRVDFSDRPRVTSGRVHSSNHSSQ